MTREFIGAANHLEKLACIDVSWQVKEHGQPPVPVEKRGTEFTIDADMALFALGFVRPERSSIIDELEVRADSQGNIKTDARHMTNVDGVFVTGDMRLGQSLVVRAIAEGRQTARALEQYLLNS